MVNGDVETPNDEGQLTISSVNEEQNIEAIFVGVNVEVTFIKNGETLHTKTLTFVEVYNFASSK